MELERRALYNSLRMNWLIDVETDVEPWEVENYRDLTVEELFHRLAEFGITLDHPHFHGLADSYDTPEELTDELLEGFDGDATEEDQIYLLIFELWRRLIPEKMCLSIFCDELDHQIYLYDQGLAKDAEAIQDALANLQEILEENVDAGGDPIEVFQSVGGSCANSLEGFLYDFISEQIDHNNDTYASELIEGFGRYMVDKKRVVLLRARILSDTEVEGDSVDAFVEQLVKWAIRDEDIEFNLDLLSFMVQEGDKGSFVKLVKKTCELLEKEEDFQDLLTISADYCSCLDCEEAEGTIRMILSGRPGRPLDDPIKPNDSDLNAFVKAIKKV